MNTHDIKKIIKEQRDYFLSGETRSVNFRIKQLEKLKSAIIRKEEDIIRALKADLYKSEFEIFVSETGFLLAEIRHFLRHLRKWVKPEKVTTPIVLFPARSRIHREPYGVVLIFSPWNYPLQLSLSPLIGAIAAGNCIVLKTAPASNHTSRVIREIIENTFPGNYITVVEGHRDINRALLAEKFDYIFFTGASEVGKKVMEAAATSLTPVTLELGGKNPCIVDEDVNLEIAAKRITWGKFLNSGQTCIAPDYLLVHKKIRGPLIQVICNSVKRLYGENPVKNPDYGRIINRKHFLRIQSYLKYGTPVCGGNSDEESLYMEPTILEDVDPESPLMNEEIFGPLLPVIEAASVDEALGIVLEKPKPLALYLFSNNKQIQKKVVDSIPYGGGCINDTVIHFINHNMPFGGVGFSGMGAYHGRYSFETFSRKKSIMYNSPSIDLPFRYAPYTKWIYRLIRKIF
ncbi:MAG: aldehyde dehydrogenase [Spirochaetales bacterium]|nr:aldehyde dehydrogenase [Spirochaetales bacterium]